MYVTAFLGVHRLQIEFYARMICLFLFWSLRAEFFVGLPRLWLFPEDTNRQQFAKRPGWCFLLVRIMTP